MSNRAVDLRFLLSLFVPQPGSRVAPFASVGLSYQPSFLSPRKGCQSATGASVAIATDNAIEPGFTLVELLIVIVILGILVQRRLGSGLRAQVPLNPGATGGRNRRRIRYWRRSKGS